MEKGTKLPNIVDEEVEDNRPAKKCKKISHHQTADNHGGDSIKLQQAAAQPPPAVVDGSGQVVHPMPPDFKLADLNKINSERQTLKAHENKTKQHVASASDAAVVAAVQTTPISSLCKAEKPSGVVDQTSSGFATTAAAQQQEKKQHNTKDGNVVPPKKSNEQQEQQKKNDDQLVAVSKQQQKKNSTDDDKTPLCTHFKAVDNQRGVCFNFLKKMLTMDRTQRISCAAAYHHPYLGSPTEIPRPCTNAEIRVNKHSRCHELESTRLRETQKHAAAQRDQHTRFKRRNT